MSGIIRAFKGMITGEGWNIGKNAPKRGGPKEINPADVARKTIHDKAIPVPKAAIRPNELKDSNEKSSNFLKNLIKYFKKESPKEKGVQKATRVQPQKAEVANPAKKAMDLIDFIKANNLNSLSGFLREPGELSAVNSILQSDKTQWETQEKKTVKDNFRDFSSAFKDCVKNAKLHQFEDRFVETGRKISENGDNSSLKTELLKEIGQKPEVKDFFDKFIDFVQDTKVKQADLGEQQIKEGTQKKALDLNGILMNFSPNFLDPGRPVEMTDFERTQSIQKALTLLVTKEDKKPAEEPPSILKEPSKGRPGAVKGEDINNLKEQLKNEAEKIIPEGTVENNKKKLEP